MTDSFDQRIAEGMAWYMADHGIANWDRNGGDAYVDDTPWPTYLGPEMPSTPNRCIVVTPGAQSFVKANVLIGVQIRVRGEVRDKGGSIDQTQQKMQAIHDLFYPNGWPLSNAMLGNVRVGAVIPGSRMPLSPDERGRHGALEEFGIRARRIPGANPPSSGTIIPQPEGSGDDPSVQYQQTTPSASWSFLVPAEFNGRSPSVQVFDPSGIVILADVRSTPTQVTVQFPTATTGFVVLT